MPGSLGSHGACADAPAPRRADRCPTARRQVTPLKESLRAAELCVEREVGARQAAEAEAAEARFQFAEESSARSAAEAAAIGALADLAVAREEAAEAQAQLADREASLLAAEEALAELAPEAVAAARHFWHHDWDEDLTKHLYRQEPPGAADENLGCIGRVPPRGRREPLRTLMAADGISAKYVY